MLACLATVEPYDLARGARFVIAVSSVNDKVNGRKVNGLGGRVWEPAMTRPPALGISLWNGDFQAAVDPAAATLPLALNVVRKSYPAIDNAVWTGALVTIYAEQAGTIWPWPARFRGRVSGYSRKGSVLTLNAQVDTEPFRANVLTRTYAGTGGAEGGADLKGRVKPLAIGWTLNVEPVLINPVDNVYQFSGYGPIEAVTKLYERGSEFPAATANYSSYATLVAATIAPGAWATCRNEGLIRLGAPGYGVITGDLKGHKVGTATPRLTGAVIAALADLAGVSRDLIDHTSLSALDVDAPYPINLLLTENVSFFDQARALALACNYQAGAGLTGQFFAKAVTLDASDSVEIVVGRRSNPEVLDTEESDVSVPYWRTVLGANRAWRVHGGDEIAYADTLLERGAYDGATVYRAGNIVSLDDGSRWIYVNAAATAGHAPPTWPTTSNAWWENLTPPLSAADLTYADGTPLEDLKPAEAGATEGAPSGTAVGSITADDVSDTVKSGGGVADDQVPTEALTDAAATAISRLFYNAAGAAVGTTGAFVSLPGGPALISVATGSKSTQQCFINAIVGVKRGGGSNEVVTFRCRRNDGATFTETFQQEATNDQAQMPLAFVDPSPVVSVTHTYEVQIYTPDSGTEIREVQVQGFVGKTG